MMKFPTLFLVLSALLMQGCASMRYAQDVSFDESLQMVVIYINLAPHTFSTTAILVPKSLELSGGDIVDAYSWPTAEAHYYEEEKDLIKYASTLPPHLRPQILGVVCRADEDDCEINTSPQTTIGYGRKMRSANDYRGVVAEAKQTIYPHEVPSGMQEFTGDKYTSSYVRRGISMEYEEPPQTQQQPHPNLCDSSAVKEQLIFASAAFTLGLGPILLSEAARNCSGTGDHWDPQEGDEVQQN